MVNDYSTLLKHLKIDIDDKLVMNGRLNRDLYTFNQNVLSVDNIRNDLNDDSLQIW